MKTFGKKFGTRLDGPHGRRNAERAAVALPAAMHSVGTSQPVSLLDVSSDGARMRYSRALYLGEEVWLKMPDGNFFGTIIWIKDDQCGMAFDQALSPVETAALQAKGEAEIVARPSFKERLALEKWKRSVAS